MSYLAPYGRKHFDYYTSTRANRVPDHSNWITYSFNDSERTIVGAIEEKNNLIFLYDTVEICRNRILYFFFENSISYKLIKVDEYAA